MSQEVLSLDAGKKGKLTKIDRLKTAIEAVKERKNKLQEDTDIKIKKLNTREEELKKELKDAQNTEFLSMLSGRFKTSEEITEFINTYNRGGYVLDLVKENEIKERTEGNNDLSDQNIEGGC